MSLITEQIKRLREYADNRKGEIADICREAAETIETLSEKVRAANMERSSAYYNGGWIPVEERLPKENGNYLVTKEVYFTPDHVDDINHYRTISVSYYDTKYSWLNAEVYAWMPLPEFYKPDDEVKQ